MLGDKIALLREKRSMSQVELAAKIGKSKQSVSNWENNTVMLSVDMLIKISEVFNVSCDYLLDLDDRHYLEVSGLDEAQIAHVQLIVNDIRNK